VARLRPRRAELLLAAEHRGTEQLFGSGLGRLEQPARLCLCPLENGSGVKGGLLALVLSLLIRELKYLQHAPADPFIGQSVLRLRRDRFVAGGQELSASVLEFRLHGRDPGLKLDDAVLHPPVVIPRGHGLEAAISLDHGLARLGALSHHRVLALGAAAPSLPSRYLAPAGGNTQCPQTGASSPGTRSTVGCLGWCPRRGRGTAPLTMLRLAGNETAAEENPQTM
jgi:hypothetical protein